MTALPERWGGARRFFRESYPFEWVLAGFFAMLVFRGGSITQNYYYLLLLLPFLMALTAADLKDLLRNRVLLAFAIYLGVLWCSLLWNDHTAPGKVLIFLRAQLVQLSFVALLAWSFHRRRVAAEQVVGLALGLYLFVAALVSLIVSAELIAAGGRLSLLMWPNPNTGASVTGVAVLLLAAGFVNCRSLWLRFAVTALLLGLLMEIVLSNSRATLLALIAASVACLVSRRFLKPFLLFAAAMLVILAMAHVAGLAPLASLARGDGARFEVWRSFWGAITDNIWRGIGIDRQFALVFNVAGGPIDNPHNTFLVALLYGGVAAGIAWIGLLAAMAQASFSAAIRHGDFLALSMFVFLTVHGLFEGVLLVEMASWQWIYALLPIGCVASVGFRSPAPALPRSSEEEA